MMSHEGTYLLDVNIDPEDMVFPMVVPGAAVDDILINPTTKYQG